MATKEQINKFISIISVEAIKQAALHGNKIFPSVCIAQACLESAYGTSPKMKNANAVFGIKVGNSKYKFGKAWKGEAYSIKTKECYDGTYVNITDMFRAYDNIADSVEDYFDMLCTASRYKYALNQPTPKACIEGIQKGPYATDPKYVSSVMSIINTYGLSKYDNQSYEPPKKPVTESNYSIGKVYTLNNDLYIRNDPNGAKVKHTCLTPDALNHVDFDEYGYAILKRGTRVTCKGIVNLETSRWMRIPSGWICAVSKDKVYVG